MACAGLRGRAPFDGWPGTWGALRGVVPVRPRQIVELPGTATLAHLPAGGVVAHKLVARSEDGTHTWSALPDAYLHVPTPGGEETTALVVF